MTEATMTGIPIEDCETCGRHHPISRRHCTSCGLALIFRCAKPDCSVTFSPGQHPTDHTPRAEQGGES